MNEGLKYGSVCSGIEAATVAWHQLGWQPVWFSEIEPFPCKVLAHHYPTVPNLGDMTKLNQHKTYNHEPIELLVGGTPCQSFSIAGLRGGMDDERGNLALEYCRILIAKQPRWFVWENVPGVFSSNGGKDFACLLSAFTGKEINPEGLGNTGVIEANGSGYSVAWRVLDAQYFGVPQRRRRVFVVGYFGNNWRAPYAVLFERDSLRRDFEAGAKARKGTAGKIEGNIDCTEHGISGTVSSKWAKSSGGPSGDEHYNLITQNMDAFNFEMFSGECNEISPCLQKDRAKDTRVYPSHGETLPAVSIDCRNDKANEEISGTLQTKSNGGQSLNFINPVVQAFGAQNSHHQSMNLDDVSPTLDKSKVPAICLQGSMIGRDDKNGPQGDGINEDVAFTLNRTDKHGVDYSIQTSQTGANGSNISENVSPVLTKNDKHAIVYDTTQITSKTNQSNPKEEICHTLAKGSDAPLQVAEQTEVVACDQADTITIGANQTTGRSGDIYATGAIARRLTPLECERLQGFPDYYTNIPGAKDSPRYASIGNSMAVPVMHWIGKRIDMMDKILKKIKPAA